MTDFTLDEKSACQKAMKWLARREYSRRELRKKLQNEGYGSEIIERVLDYLHERNFQSDARFCENWINAKSKNYGSTRLKESLRQKGISSQIIAQYLPDNESDIALNVLQKKFDVIENNFQMKQKYAQFLNYRGFNRETIRKAIDRFLTLSNEA